MKPSHTCIAGPIGMLSALALGAVAYLAFLFPKTVRIWMDEGRTLSVFEKLLVNLSQLCSSFGLVIIPICLGTVIGCFIWAMRSAGQAKA